MSAAYQHEPEQPSGAPNKPIEPGAKRTRRSSASRSAKFGRLVMDAREYKDATSSPDAFAAGDLDATIACLRAMGSNLALSLSRASRAAVPEPSQHHGGPETDFLRINLSLDVVRELVEELLAAEAAAVSAEGMTTPEASRRAELVDRWGRYQRWLESRAEQRSSTGREKEADR